ncbi:hypothetical protein [Microbacterium aerolatum]|uniref:hypothetical protein n=1 Tax=Microbacterium aerolatum TaxID=153731 RepID=UPI003851471F
MGVQHLGEVGLKQEIALLWRAIRRISKATLQNSSIGRAVLRFYAGGRIRIEDGGGIDIVGGGYINISGNINGSGDFEWTGPMSLKGAQSITGPTTFTGQMTVNGPWTFAGNGQITGNVGLTGDLNVTGGGRIKAGAVTINPSSGGGTIELGSSEIRGSGSGVGIFPGTGAAIITSEAGVRIAYLPTISSASTGLPPDTIHVDALGYLRRVV